MLQTSCPSKPYIVTCGSWLVSFGEGTKYTCNHLKSFGRNAALCIADFPADIVSNILCLCEISRRRNVEAHCNERAEIGEAAW